MATARTANGVIEVDGTVAPDHVQKMVDEEYPWPKGRLTAKMRSLHRALRCEAARAIMQGEAVVTANIRLAQMAALRAENGRLSDRADLAVPLERKLIEARAQLGDAERREQQVAQATMALAQITRGLGRVPDDIELTSRWLRGDFGHLRVEILLTPGVSKLAPSVLRCLITDADGATHNFPVRPLDGLSESRGGLSKDHQRIIASMSVAVADSS
jgi:hypothetical protein